MADSSRRAFWNTVTKYQSNKVAPFMGLRNAAGVILPLLPAAITGGMWSALLISTGALNVSFSDSTDAYRRRAGRMLAASVIVACSVTAGAVAGQNHTIAVLVCMAWAFAAGLLVAVGPAEADIGLISLVTLIVFSSEPQGLPLALSSGLLAFSGGLLQTLLSSALWPLRSAAPERRALADLYLALGREGLTFIATEAPPASFESNQAQQAIADAAGSRSMQAERHRSLLNQAERIRLSLLALRRLMTRLQRRDEGKEGGQVIERGLEPASRVLQAVGKWLENGSPMRAAAEDLRRLEAVAEELESVNADDEAAQAEIDDARFQLDALAGQLRAAVDLAATSSEAGLKAMRTRESRRPWQLRVTGTLATLKANLNGRSAAFRHAVRLAVCVGLGDAIARSFGLERSYWVPMTVAIVLKPDFAATFSRGLLRLAGTVAGLVIATVLLLVLPKSPLASVGAIGVFTFLLRAYGSANYGIIAVTVTGLVVMLFGLGGIAPDDVMRTRALDTLVGGVLALGAFQLWPTWERTQIADAIAAMLDGYRLYFRALRRNLEPELERERVAARLARSNVEAAMERLSAEPGTTPATLDELNAIMAAANRVVHAMMALEASGLEHSPALDIFANHVELTLYFQASALRGSKLSREELPDLREDHHELIRTGGRHSLVNVETDRLTNSLNTLTEVIAQRRSAP